jgi:hypothetical protein
MTYVIWIVFSIFLVFLALGYSELRAIAANIKEISKPPYNKYVMPFANCTGCHWRNHCVLTFGGEVCQLKYESRTA